jgi:hypothetical protein
MPTKDELERENAELRARVAELEEGAPAAGQPRIPQRPDFGLSAGEADDLRVRGVTTSPFNGEELNALDEGIEPATPEARRNAEKAQARKRDRDRIAAGAADPAEPGDVVPELAQGNR